ncbi:MAG: acetate--CoA ligase family protein [Desulfobulbaceae bacterium]|jgi:acetyltransferase|nr:acetate--CoA ligase family protein [Desulfobulbaceae bacterium]
MEKFFYPESIAIIGLSNRETNVSRIILANLVRWGFHGRIFGVNPTAKDRQVNGIKMFKHIADLPEVPTLAVAMLPARFIPSMVKECGEFGIKRVAIPAAGFNETSDGGGQLADELLQNARRYQVRLVGPNCLTVANTANGLCLPFSPLYPPPKGGLSIITQSGGIGLVTLNFFRDENIGLAKFASIGNKLDLDEVDFLNYFASDPETKVIFIYVESINNGQALIEAASRCDKPIIMYKSNNTAAGGKAAVSHTAAISNNEDIIDSALERAGVIRITKFHDFIPLTKVFALPPMKGKRVLAMSPAGGFSVIMADLCEKAGFEFAQMSQGFYDEISHYANAGIIKISNPLDMGDIYNPKWRTEIFYSGLHDDNVDGAFYLTQWPKIPAGNDIFSGVFHTDLSHELIGAMRSSGKPLGFCLFGPSNSITKIKNNLSIPIFDGPEEMVASLKIQQEFYARKRLGQFVPSRPAGLARDEAARWLDAHGGVIGEESGELLRLYGINMPVAQTAATADEAVAAARQIGYPVVMKVVSPDAVHKSEAGGVVAGLGSDEAVATAFASIRDNLLAYKSDAVFQGVRVAAMAGPGHDMFIGGLLDISFGPVLVFGYGGIYVEMFNDTERALCPTCHDEVAAKLARLKCQAILQGRRGQGASDIAAFIDIAVRVACLLADFPQIKELDLNPVRVFAAGGGALALDARMRIG